MEPVNLAERRKAFINFFIFFVITTCIVVAAVIFSAEVPFKENEQLRNQMKISESEKDFSDKFLTSMNATNSLLDSLDRDGVNVVLIDGKIAERLKSMDAMIDNDSVSAKDFYQNVVANLSEFHSAKKELRDATSKDASLGELKQELSQLKDDLLRSQNQVVILQTQLTMQRRD